MNFGLGGFNFCELFSLILLYEGLTCRIPPLVIILGGSSFCLEQEMQPISQPVFSFFNHCVGLRLQDGGL